MNNGGSRNLRVMCFGGPGVKQRLVTINERWDETFPEWPWKLEAADDLLELSPPERYDVLLRAMLNQEVDLIIYQLSEGSFDIHPALCLAAVTERDNSNDFLCVRAGEDLDEGDDSIAMTLARIKTLAKTSMRRETQMRLFAPKIELVDAPNSFDKRLQALKAGDFDAMVVSGMELPGEFLMAEGKNLRLLPLAPETMLPAVGQGSLGLVTRLSDPELIQRLEELFDDPESRRCFEAERLVLRRLGQNDSCRMTARATIRNGGIHMHALNCAGGPEFLKRQTEMLTCNEDEAISPVRLANFCDLLLGNITFMGAGPADSELLTYAAIQALREADILYLDPDVGDHIYRWIRCETSALYTDKEDFELLCDPRAEYALRQSTRRKISETLLEIARMGCRIVRVYSDASLAVGAYEEESRFLKEAQIPCDWYPALGSYQTSRIDHALRPLQGRIFTLTRPEAILHGMEVRELPMSKAQEELPKILRKAGAQVLHSPLHRGVSHEQDNITTDRQLTRFLNCVFHPDEDKGPSQTFIILSSAWDVEAFFESLMRLEVDVRALLEARFLASNENVARALLKHGIQADFVSYGGFRQLKSAIEDELVPGTEVLWSRMKPQKEGTFRGDDVDSFDGSLPYRLQELENFLLDSDACVTVMQPYTLERVVLCQNRQRHFLGVTTDIIVSSPLEAYLLADLLELSPFSTMKEFSEKTHIYATTPKVLATLQELGCKHAIEISLRDTPRLIETFLAAPKLEREIKAQAGMDH